MPSKKPVLSIGDNVRRELNDMLTDLQQIHDEASKQAEAGVPEMEAVVDRCKGCMERIAQFKAVNFPNKR